MKTDSEPRETDGNQGDISTHALLESLLLERFCAIFIPVIIEKDNSTH